jgi:hypothetical protein
MEMLDNNYLTYIQKGLLSGYGGSGGADTLMEQPKGYKGG